MIKACFYSHNNNMVGAIIKGHSNLGAYGHNISCAAATTAVMMTINTISDFFGVHCDIRVYENAIGIKILEPSKTAATLLLSLATHLEIINLESPKRVIQITEQKV